MPKGNTDADKTEQFEREYESRNESLRAAIDACASVSRPELGKHGTKSDLAEEHGVDYQKIHYVLNEWGHLVDHRRAMNASPVDDQAVVEAYDDETLEKMAKGDVIVADGASDVRVQFDLRLDQAFRAIKLLPGDLGIEFYLQLLETEGLPRDQLRQIMRSE